MFVGGPGVFGDGAFDVEALAGGEGVDVFGHGAVLVAFYYEVQVAFGVCAGTWSVLSGLRTGSGCVKVLTFITNRCIRLDSRLLIAFTLVLRNQGTSDTQPTDSLLVIKLKPKLLGVVVDVLNLVQHEGYKTLVAAREDFGRVGGLGGYFLLFSAGRWCCLAPAEVPGPAT